MNNLQKTGAVLFIVGLLTGVPVNAGTDSSSALTAKSKQPIITSQTVVPSWTGAPVETTSTFALYKQIKNNVLSQQHIFVNAAQAQRALQLSADILSGIALLNRAAAKYFEVQAQKPVGNVIQGVTGQFIPVDILPYLLGVVEVFIASTAQEREQALVELRRLLNDTTTSPYKNMLAENLAKVESELKPLAMAIYAQSGPVVQALQTLAMSQVPAMPLVPANAGGMDLAKR